MPAEISRIGDVMGSHKAETLGVSGGSRRCLFYKEETCSAPHLRFEACRGCYRIDPRLAVRTLFEKIKSLAVQLFNLEATKPEQLPPDS